MNILEKIRQYVSAAGELKMLSCLAGSAILVLASCQDPVTDPPPDLIAPDVDILYSPGNGDSNADGFINFVIHWGSARDVNARATTIRDISESNRITDVNLTDVWDVQITDSAMFVTEQPPYILTGGIENPRVLEVIVSDSAGNTRRGVISLLLPHAKFLKTISTGRDANFVLHAVELAICPDGLGYMPAGLNMVIFDPDSMKLIADIPHPGASEALGNLTCDRSDNTIYVTDPLMPFSVTTRTWGGRVPGTFRGNVLRPSPSRSNIIYIGEVDGGVAAFDRATRTRVGRVGPPAASNDDFVFAMAVMPNDEKIYATRALEGGVIVIDPRAGVITKRIGIGGSGSAGTSAGLKLDPTAQFLYITVLDGLNRGVAIVSTVTDEIVGFIPLINAVPSKIGVSPSGKRLFVTTADLWPDTPSENALIDAAGRKILQLFPRPRSGGRWDAEVVFHPHGKYFYVARNLDVDVYLNRE